MENNYFDSCLEAAAAGANRREFLMRLGQLAFLGVTSSLVAACGGKKPTATPSPPLSPSSTGTPEPACSAASRCGDRHYCDEKEECVCTKSAEGNLVCGRPPNTCHMPLCQSSADCGYLGVGYFCDTPDSGCCTDPPASATRCIPPCFTEPVPSVECSACADCATFDMGDIPALGVPAPLTVKNCNSRCDPQVLCDEANSEIAFRRLADSLRIEGFRSDGLTNQYTFSHSGHEVRRMFVLDYKNLTNQRTAALIRGRDAEQSEVGTYALVLEQKRVIYGLRLGDSGYIEKVFPDAESFSVPTGPFNSDLWGEDEKRLVRAVDTATCGISCNSLCNLLAGGVSCSVAVFFICSFTGPGALLCAVVMGSTCSAVSGAACYATCEQGICKPKPLPRDIWCSCNQTCYSTASDCLADCKVGLGCFTGICQPNSAKCRAEVAS